MLHLLYNLTIRAYTALIRIVSPFNPKARLWVTGRKGGLEAFSRQRGTEEKWLWFHCSSLGEYEDCCELFSEMRKRIPGSKVLLTFFSPSGYEALKSSPLYDYILYLPPDKPFNVQVFLNIVKPSVVLFGRSELWLNYLSELKKRQIAVFLISLKLHANSGFLKQPALKLYTKAFGCFTHIFCQDQLTATLLETKAGIQHTTITGNTRFERIYKESLMRTEFPEIARFSEGHFTLIAGSCLPKDLQIIRPAIDGLLAKGCRLLLVPHEIDGPEIRDLLQAYAQQAIAYSELAKLTDEHRIVVVDHVGSLKHLYAYADLALVGGGFNKIGIHNIIEPAIYGLVTLFGPNHRQYREALDLIDIGGAMIYRTTNELTGLIEQQLSAPVNAEKREQIRQYVWDHVPDSRKIADLILTQLPSECETVQTMAGSARATRPA